MIVTLSGSPTTGQRTWPPALARSGGFTAEPVAKPAPTTAPPVHRRTRGIGPETMRMPRAGLRLQRRRVRPTTPCCGRSAGKRRRLLQPQPAHRRASACRRGRQPFSLIAVDFKPGRWRRSTPPPGVAIRGRLALSGRLLAPEATVTLNYGFGKAGHPQRAFTSRHPTRRRGI